MKIKCDKCNTEFDSKMFKLHIKNSHSNSFNSNDELEFFVLKVRFKLDENKIKNIIKDYENDGSVFSLVNKYKIPNKSLTLLLRLNGVKLKKISEIAQQKSVRDKYVKTCKEKYGVDNVSSSLKIKEKKKETFLKHYGVDNVFKDPETIKLFSTINEKIYGKKRLSGWDYLDNVGKAEWVRKLNSQRGKLSSIEKRIGDVLFNLGIIYTPQFEIKNKFYDYKIDGVKLIIEVNGDFWHANPKKYKPADIIPFPNKKGCKKQITAKDVWKKDEKKRLNALKHGYFVLPLWENDINKLTDVELGIIILNKINEIKNGK